MIEPLWTLFEGDCLEQLRQLPDDCVDAVVTDPPAGIEFMGAEWDKFTRQNFISWLTAVMVECLRVLKPGGHALVWSLPRTSHWTATALEGSGFEIRDAIYNVKDRSAEVQAFVESLSLEQQELLSRAAPTDSWVQHVFGQGWPKSLNISKAIDKAAGAARTVVGTRTLGGQAALTTKEKGGTYAAGGMSGAGRTVEVPITEAATEEAKQWEGWGTALKPAVETWWLCRKPIAESTVAAQVLATGTGAINVDGSRIYTDWNENDRPESWKQSGNSSEPGASSMFGSGGTGINLHAQGRWPANLVLTHSEECVPREQIIIRRPSGFGAVGADSGDGSELVRQWDCAPGCPVRLLDEQSGELASGEGTIIRASSKNYGGNNTYTAESRATGTAQVAYGDSGHASRFFHRFETEPPFYYTGKANDRGAFVEHKNTHPTVKSDKLMQHLVRLITPPGGIVLDPFMGSGSTGVAALRLGMRFIGIEKHPEYVAIARERLQHWQLASRSARKGVEKTKGQTKLPGL